jgi:hypothetical protein
LNWVNFSDQMLDLTINTFGGETNKFCTNKRTKLN